MANFLGYNDQLWKEIHKFTYTGQPQEFTLTAGTYLLICKGAVGGKGLTDTRAMGGMSCGILTLNESQKMYAYVGGDGEDCTPGVKATEPKGGWNGGGDGGIGYSTYINGAGGGGGTDIRLERPEDIVPEPQPYYPSLPVGYTQLEYLQTNNDGTHAFETGHVPTDQSVFTSKFSVDTATSSNCLMGVYKNTSNTLTAKDVCSILLAEKTSFTCDPEYYFDTTVTADVGGNMRQKSNTIPAVGVIVYSSVMYSFPVFISPDPAGTHINVSQQDAMGATVTYAGITWYWTREENGVYGDQTDLSGNMVKYPIQCGWDNSIRSIPASDILAILAYANTTAVHTPTPTEFNVTTEIGRISNSLFDTTIDPSEENVFIFKHNQAIQNGVVKKDFGSSCAQLAVGGTMWLAQNHYSTDASQDSFYGKYYYTRIYKRRTYLCDTPATCIFAGRESVKLNSVPTIAALVRLSSWCGPFFVSTVESAIHHSMGTYESDLPNASYPGIEFTYRGLNWYAGTSDFWMQASGGYDAYGNLDLFVSSRSAGDPEGIAKDLIDAVFDMYNLEDGVSPFTHIYDIQHEFIPTKITGSRLPAGYTECEYIRTTGQYILNAWTINSGSMRVEATAKWIRGSANESDLFGNFGMNNGGSYNCVIGGIISGLAGDNYLSYQNTGNTSTYAVASNVASDVVTAHNFVWQVSSAGRYFTVDDVTWSGVGLEVQNKYSFVIFAAGPELNAGGWPPPDGYLYKMRVYDGDTLIRNFIPALNSNNEPGLYDTVNDQFYIKSGGTGDFGYTTIDRTGTLGFYDTVNKVFQHDMGTGTVTAGPIGEYEIPYEGTTFEPAPPSALEQSLLSRFIVAGGGGGGCIYTYTDLPDYASFGGGVNGGPIIVNGTGAGMSRANAYTTQTNGFAFGMSGKPKTKTTLVAYGAEGASGGGGGWYGGYVIDETVQNSSGPGGGGSGYVLTSTSIKPTGYSVPASLQMTHPLLLSNKSTAASVEVYQLSGTSELDVGDNIKFFQTGSPTKLTLNPGQYTLKCWGADGGVRALFTTAARGGYAEGTINLPSQELVEVFVGGSGIGDNLISSAYTNQCFPELSANGGGAPSAVGSTANGDGRSGGGASDIRIITGLGQNDDSLYARVIVAGGAGGQSSGNGGVGGGETGGNPTGSAGQNAGPGTQTGSPESATLLTTGGFGYGGSSDTTGTYAGGAGGSGWYGGSGTIPASSDANKGGAGGSGYVLTTDSYKPTGYLLDQRYDLTDTTLTAGGNNLPIGNAQVEIDVLAINTVSILCRDADGVKYYNAGLSRWVFLANELTDDLFASYGVPTFPNDTGLLDEYEVLAYDAADEASAVAMTFVPNTQHIVCDDLTSQTVDRIVPDFEYDPAVYDVDYEVTREPRGSLTKIHTDISITKKQISNKIAKIYSITYFTK